MKKFKSMHKRDPEQDKIENEIESEEEKEEEQIHIRKNSS
jgi:hypothetical protein